jgi:peptidyl-prolyl cis-trans isomerase SurA
MPRIVKARNRRGQVVRKGKRIVALVGAAFAVFGVVRGEVVEEIVAKVNDDIITRSDLESEEQALVAELYKTYSGEKLDEQVAATRRQLLRQMIEQKLLLHRAQRVFDMTKMGDAILRGFKEQQQIKSDKDLEKLLSQEGMTLTDFRRRLLEYYAPRQVLDAEVRDRVSVGDAEVEAYYQDHGTEFDVPAEATFREIVLLAGEEDMAGRRAEAERVRERAVAPGADFAALAREVSEAGTKEQGGLLGPVHKGDLLPALEEVVFRSPIGEVSPVVEMPYGFHIVRVESRAETHRTGLDEVREDLRRKLSEEKFLKALDDYLRKAWSEASVQVASTYRERLSLPWNVPVGTLGEEPSSK